MCRVEHEPVTQCDQITQPFTLDSYYPLRLRHRLPHCCGSLTASQYRHRRFWVQCRIIVKKSAILAAVQNRPATRARNSVSLGGRWRRFAAKKLRHCSEGRRRSLKPLFLRPIPGAVLSRGHASTLPTFVDKPRIHVSYLCISARSVSNLSGGHGGQRTRWQSVHV